MYGAGVNDIDYVTQVYKTDSNSGKGEQVEIYRHYSKWAGMLTRCYDKKFLAINPTYIGCTVDPDWLYLSNFIKWVENQPNRDWRNCQLDKDILVEGNKHYSPSTCVFISRSVNNFIVSRGADRGAYLIGVCWHKDRNKYLAQCRNPFKVNTQHVGYFNTELEAHKAWQARKHEYALQLADLQSDIRVAEVLRTKYAPDKDWTTR